MLCLGEMFLVPFEDGLFNLFLVLDGCPIYSGRVPGVVGGISWDLDLCDSNRFVYIGVNPKELECSSSFFLSTDLSQGRFSPGVSSKSG